MRKIYEVGDVFKYTYLSGIIEYYIIAVTDKSLIYKLINLTDGCGFEEGMDEESLTKFINNEGFDYLGQTKDIIEIKNINDIVIATPYEQCTKCPYIKN